MKKRFFLSKRPCFLFLLSLAFFPSAVLGQGEWQWAKSYTGQDAYGGYPNNEIMSAEFDADGNIYVLGKFGYGASIDGERIIPDSIISIMSSAPLSTFSYSDQGMVIAKFSPQGGLVWKKVIRTEDIPSCAFQLQVKGDKVHFLGSVFFGHTLYYLDTLAVEDDYSVPYDSLADLPYSHHPYTCFVTLDLDGNVVDEHFLKLYQRESLTFFGAMKERVYHQLTFSERSFFHIDRSGNTYLLVEIGHWGAPLDEPLTIVVDEEKSFDFYTFRAAADENNCLVDWMLFKFSPEWDLLWYKQLVSHATGISFAYPTGQPNGYIQNVHGMASDEEDNLYVCGDLNLGGTYNTFSFPVRIYWDSVHHTSISASHTLHQQSYLCKYDTSGNVVWTKQLYPFTTGRFAASSFKDAIIAGNDIYALAYAAVFYNEDPAMNIFIDEAMTVPVGRHNGQQARAALIKYDKRTGEYATHGFVPDEVRSASGNKGAMINNHVVFSSGKGIGLDTSMISYFRDDCVLMASEAVFNTGHAVDQNAGDVRIHESGALFFHKRTSSGLTIGGFHLPHGGGNSMAAFALMDDPSLLVPYDYDDPDGIASHDLDGGARLYPNPARSVVNIRFEDDGADFLKAELFNLNGQKLREYGSPTFSVSSLPSGFYLLKIYTNKGIHVKKFAKTN